MEDATSSSDSEPEFEEVAPVVLPGAAVTAGASAPPSDSESEAEGPSAEELQRAARERAEYDDLVRENARIANLNATPGYAPTPAAGAETEMRSMTLEEAAAALADAMAQARATKDKGNVAFAGADLDRALSWYSAATRSLNGWDDLARQLGDHGVRKAGAPTPAALLGELRVDLAMNTAAANLRQKNFSAVLANCREAFAFDRKCVKALYRSGVALEALGRVGDAEDAFRRAAAADPANREVARRLEAVRRNARRSKKATKAAFGGLFGRKEYRDTAGADANKEARRAREDRAEVLKRALARARAVLEADDPPEGVDRGDARDADAWAAASPPPASLSLSREKERGRHRARRHGRACERLAAGGAEETDGARGDQLWSDRRVCESILERASRVAKTPATAAAGEVPADGGDLDAVVARTLVCLCRRRRRRGGPKRGATFRERFLSQTCGDLRAEMVTRSARHRARKTPIRARDIDKNSGEGTCRRRSSAARGRGAASNCRPRRSWRTSPAAV